MLQISFNFTCKQGTKFSAFEHHGCLPILKLLLLLLMMMMTTRVDGSVGSGRSWVEGTAELRFPIVKALHGSLFFDSGSDLDSGATVVGDPAGARNKPGRWVTDLSQWLVGSNILSL